MQAESTAVSMENEDHFVSLAGQALENIKDCLHFKAIVSVVFRGGISDFCPEVLPGCEETRCSGETSRLGTSQPRVS